MFCKDESVLMQAVHTEQGAGRSLFALANRDLPRVQVSGSTRRQLSFRQLVSELAHAALQAD